MGFISYRRKFVKDFAGLTKHIYHYELLDKNKIFFGSKKCKCKCKAGFEKIKGRIVAGLNLTLLRVQMRLISYVVSMNPQNTVMEPKWRNCSSISTIL